MTPEFQQKVLKLASEMAGGHEALIRAAIADRRAVENRWNQNTEAIGRILRAHLFVEQYLDDYLQASNPALGSVSNARLRFAQKVTLLPNANLDIASVLPGIRALNAIRNRLAHRPKYLITPEDVGSFLQCKRFVELSPLPANDAHKPEQLLLTLEEFAKHVALVLSYRNTPFTRALDDAIVDLVRNGET